MKVPGKLLGNGVLEGDGKQWRKRGRYRVPRKNGGATMRVLYKVWNTAKRLRSRGSDKDTG